MADPFSSSGESPVALLTLFSGLPHFLALNRLPSNPSILAKHSSQRSTHKMDMVGHQTICPYLQTKALTICCQPYLVSDEIGFIFEDRLSIVSALGNMVRISFYNCSCYSWHALKISLLIVFVSYIRNKPLTLFLLFLLAAVKPGIVPEEPPRAYLPEQSLFVSVIARPLRATY